MFGLRYKGVLRSQYKNVFWRVEIAERDYSGPAEDLVMSLDGEPLKITWEKKSDEFFVPVKGSELELNVFCDTNFKYIDLYTSDPRYYRVSVYRNTKLFWQGFIVSDTYSESFAPPPYDVSIKAVDGFSVLSGIPFKTGNAQKITGRKSLWELIEMCIGKLELELNVADWMDLYAEGMDQTLPALSQVYISLDNYYQIKEEPIFRDIIELCLTPFGAQIFQSNGAIHIRRVMSLYDEYRPVTFSNVGATQLITATGEVLKTANDEPIITTIHRDRIESIWSENMDQLADSTLEISPALRSVVVKADNGKLKNCARNAGLLTQSKWPDPVQVKDDDLILYGSDNGTVGTVIEHAGFHVSKALQEIKISAKATPKITRNGTGVSIGPNREDIAFEYAVKLIGAEKTYWYTDEDEPRETEAYKSATLNFNEETELSITIPEIPFDGTLVFAFKQAFTIIGNAYYTKTERCILAAVSLGVNPKTDSNGNEDDVFDESLTTTVVVNEGNTEEMTIEPHFSDIPNMPNNSLIYSVFPEMEDGTPTALWCRKGKQDYDTLAQHLAISAVTLRQNPAITIDGPLFTSRHVDMNTVLCDDKFLHRGLYVNSISLAMWSDSYEIKAVELPNLTKSELPAEGDDCVTISHIDTKIIRSCACGNDGILLLDENEDIILLKASQGRTKTVLSGMAGAYLTSFNGGAFVSCGKSAYQISQAGYLMDTFDNSAYNILAAVKMAGTVYVAVSNARSTVLVPFENIGQAYRRNYGISVNGFSGLVCSNHIIGLGGDVSSAIYDERIQIINEAEVVEGHVVLSVSDYYTVTAFADHPQITIHDKRRGYNTQIPGPYRLVAQTPASVAISSSDRCAVWSPNQPIYDVINATGLAAGSIVGIHYIAGNLYIVRERGIFKLIR